MVSCPFLSMTPVRRGHDGPRQFLLNSFGPSLVILGRFLPQPGPLGLIFGMGRGTQILWPHTYILWL